MFGFPGAGYGASGLAAFAAGGLDRLERHVQPVERDLLYPPARRGVPARRRRGAASSMSMAHMPPSAGLGSEFKWDISTAQSRAVSLSKLTPRPLGSIFRTSTWLRSQPPFCWDWRTSQ